MTASLSIENAESQGPLNPDPAPVVEMESEKVSTTNSTSQEEEEQQRSPITNTSQTPITPVSQTLGDAAMTSYVLPRCQLPPASEFEPVEKFVQNAIQSQHAETPDPAFAQGYRAIGDALRRPTDPTMVWKVLLALRTAGKGCVLNLLTSGNKHVHLLHLIFRFNSTTPPKMFEEEEEETATAGGISKKDIYTNGSMLEAHLHLILAIVSSKSVHVVPALTRVWKLLAFRPNTPPLL
jgi:hypothetical protein